MGFLDIKSSLTDREWIGPNQKIHRLAESISQYYDLPMPVCMVLARIGISPDKVPSYLSPKLRDLLPNPKNFRDMEKAAGRLVKAIDYKEKIAIFADYDVDGAASAALLKNWFTYFRIDTTIYIPDRIFEGYGPNKNAMISLASKHDLIICVDCGTISFEAISAVKQTDVIVLDHHLGAEKIPDCLAVVNPNRRDENGDMSHLCAAAIVFLCLVECAANLRKRQQKVPNLLQSLDLVALATVADVAPLIGVNRAFVQSGLKVLSQRERPGLMALCDSAGVMTSPKAYHLGFVLGPRINAGGRVGQADLGAKLFSINDLTLAKQICGKLEQFNKERKIIEEGVTREALKQIEALGTGSPLVWAASENWHPGVLGIVASRIKEITNRPTFIISIDGKKATGSGRSVSGIDLGAAIQDLAMEGFLLKGGGHKMAAGFSLEVNKLEIVMQKLTEAMERQGAHLKKKSELRFDGLLTTTSATIELLKKLDQVGPYGASAPSPRFIFPDMEIKFSKRVGKNHLKLRFNEGSGKSMDAICFNAYDTPMGLTLEKHRDNKFHLAGKLETNLWNGRENIQLLLEDAAPA